MRNPAIGSATSRCFAGSIRLYSLQAAAVACASAGPHAKMVKGVSSNAARLGRDRSRIRLHRVPVSGCKLWRPPVADAARPRQRADLSAVAGDLLHVLDVLRL